MANDVVFNIRTKVPADSQAKIIALRKDVEGLSSAAASVESTFAKSVSAFKSIGPPALAAGAAVYALKKSFDLVSEAEEIKAVNQEFEVLSRNAGISAEVLKRDLVGFADGLADDTDLLKAAGQAIIAMGQSAAGIAPVMEIARKATSVFGGEITQNFQAITQAIAGGQTKALKNFGIIVDQDEVYRKFAKTIGVTADQLSVQGKQQALLNAVVEQGRKSFQGVDDNMRAAEKSSTRLGVTLGQIAETGKLLFERIFGDLIRKGMSALNDMASGVLSVFKAIAGTDAEKAEERAKQLKNSIGFLGNEIARLQTLQKSDVRFKSVDEQARLNASIEAYRGKLAAAQAELAKFGGEQSKSADSTKRNTSALIDQAKIAEDARKILQQAKEKEDPAAKYQKDIDALKTANQFKIISDQEYLSAKALLEQQASDAHAEAEARKVDKLLDRNEKLRALDDSFYQAEIDANNAKVEKILSQEKVGSEAYIRIRARVAAEEKKLDEQRLTASSTFFGGMAALAKAGGRELFDTWKTFAKAQALIDGYAAVQKALASAPPPFNFIAAAGVGLQTAANVININKTNLATGITEVPAGYPNDTFAANLSSGERVLSVRQNEDMKDFMEEQRGVAPLLAGILQRLDAIADRPVMVMMDGDVVFRSVSSRLQDGRAFAV